MKIAIAADEARPVVEHIATHLRARGHEVTTSPITAWAEAAIGVARAVHEKRAEMGIVCCWTGTGVSIAANKVVGVRCALVTDAESARGARTWNDANMLALSLRLTSDAVATEIVDAWLDATYSGTENASLAVIAAEERRAE